MLQRRAIEKLHGDEGMPVLFTDVMDCADVRMIQSRSGLSLPLKAGQRLRVTGDIFWQELERDKAMQA